MFAKARRHRDSLSDNPPSNHTPVSPLDQRFDLAAGHDSQLQHQLHSPVSQASRPSAESVRRRTNDATRRSIVSLQPPVLPPIPRVASRYESATSSNSRKEPAEKTQEEERKHTQNILQGSAVAPIAEHGSRQSSSAGPVLSPVETTSTTSENWPEINFDEPRMEATMFPRHEPQASGDPFTAGPPMTRSFIDSRDRPYSHNVQRPAAVASSHSSPNVLAPRSATAQGLRPSGPSPTLRSNPPSAASLEGTRKASSGTGTSYSGSTARPSIQSSKSASASPLSQTIGTPYSETSASFPAPQHVSTRPKTMGSSSTIAGVMVPTHHTNGAPKDKAKPEKRKTRLLNPMALLQRRRSEQATAVVPDEAERRAHEQAQMRQRSVATSGINTIPEDFDPRIRGKIVHDFNAPRPRRTVSSNDAALQDIPNRELQSADSMPAMPTGYGQVRQQRPAVHTQTSDGSSRHSRHTPIFVEHFDEEPTSDGMTHSIQAERLENKDFLKRASHHSSPSQESSVLPPFARRSQQMDPMQASFYRDDDSSKRSSDQSGIMNRESMASSGVAVSPIAARASTSPISPEGTEKNRRPVSDMSMLGGRFDAQTQHAAPSFGEFSRGTKSSVHYSKINENSSPAQQLSRGNSPPAPQAIHPALRGFANGPGSPKSGFQDPTSARSSPAIGSGSSVPSTPEPVVADAQMSFQSPSSPPRLVEKRASAVGHSKPASSLIPKHAASTASRFSFQLDESAAEEKALEEKHRRVAESKPQWKKSVRDDDEDEDDYFDEDAMDDEDEMESQMRMNDGVGGNVNSNGFGDGVARFQHQPANLMPQSDASSVYEEDTTAPRKDRELTYAEHPAFRGHSAVYSSKHTSMAPSMMYSNDRDGWNRQHQRGMSDATVMSLADSDIGVGTGRGGILGSGFYLQPEAAGYGMGADGQAADGRGINRDSTMTVSTVQSNGERAQSPRFPAVAGTPVQSPRFSGFKFTDSPERPSTSDYPQRQSGMAIAHGPAGSQNAFTYPPASVPTLQPANTSYAYGTNDKLDSAAYNGSIGQSIRDRHVSTNQNLQYAAPSESGTESTQDDMYFDDGGFGDDIQNSSGGGESINEEVFDHPDFAGGYKGMEPRGYHERHASAMTITGRDGPYPVFAMPNPGKVAQRESQMMLEDLPLQAPNDTHLNNSRLVPQRNPSDDAKRLGLSDQVPPLPAQPGAPEALPQIAAYHQALADAANRAAKDGRFTRQGSVSTAKSSLYSVKDEYARPAERISAEAEDDKSRYSRDTDADATAGTAAAPHRNLLQLSSDVDGSGSLYASAPSYSQPGAAYTPPRMSGFDFGFNAPASNQSSPARFVDYNAAPTDANSAAPIDDYNAAPTDAYSFAPSDSYSFAPSDAYSFAPSDDLPPNAAPTDAYTSHLDDSYDPDDDDEAFIAAANAEALAHDDQGFYGQEFGFYARARSDSVGSNGHGHSNSNSKNYHNSQKLPPLEAVNGGFFGADGEDPLKRQNFSREPDLTPITERSEFSARNSFINFGPASASWGAAGGVASPALARLPLSPLVGGAAGSRASGGGYFGVFPASQVQQQGQGQGFVGASPASEGPASARPWTNGSDNHSPVSATSSSGRGDGFRAAAATALDPDATPRKPHVGVSSPLSEAPGTARKGGVNGGEINGEREGKRASGGWI